MRDPAGKLTDRFHFLRLKQPLSGLLQHLMGEVPFRDVACYLREANECSCVIANGIGNDARSESATVLANPPAFGFKSSVFRRLPECTFRHAFPLVFLGVEQGKMLADDL